MITAEKQETERLRIGKLVPRFFLPLLRAEWDILSIGCGAGNDVLELRRRGYKAWGLDPDRLSPDDLAQDQRDFFRVGTMEQMPFGGRQFDFAYALDVIEHVGCVDFRTRLREDAWPVRRDFLASCLKAVKPGGTLLLTTSNKLCPVDVGHWHHYHWFGRAVKGRHKFGLSLPWNDKNFLLSFGEIERLAANALGPDGFEIDYVATANYPSVAERNDFLSRIVSGVLRFLDKPMFIGSPFAPLLIVQIRKAASF